MVKRIVMEDKQKHLEFIQGVINRHNSNSFMIKGWAITIVAAFLALMGTINEPYLSFIALGPTLMFWVLDSMFLANEKCFVSLYNCVANGNKLSINKSDLKKNVQKEIQGEVKEFHVGDYSMDFSQFREIIKNNWKAVFWSYTIRWFYIALSILILVTFFGLKEINDTKANNPIRIDATIQNSGSLKIEPLEVLTNKLSIDTLNIKEVNSSKPEKNNKN